MGTIILYSCFSRLRNKLSKNFECPIPQICLSFYAAWNFENIFIVNQMGFLQTYETMLPYD